MLATLLEWIASKLPAPRVIYDRAGVSAYLSRWYLLGAPFMPDGSHPFDEHGDPRPGIQDPDRPFAVYLHKFHRGDEDLELHNHPWRWSVALVLSGGYREERRRGAPEKGGWVFVREVRPPAINLIHHDTFHRVTLLEKTAWSIFVAGPREKGWGFWNRSSGVFTPWREFLTMKRDPTAFAQDDARRTRDTNFYANSAAFVDASADAIVAELRSEQTRAHCAPGERLLEIEAYAIHDSADDEPCDACDKNAKLAERGDARAHNMLLEAPS